MGMYDLRYLSNKQVYVCHNCQTHLSSPDDVISKSFQGAFGRAYLFNTVVNVCESGLPEDRNMTTGLHTVVDIKCKKCETTLGWKYEKAHESSQKYKEGKYILEKKLIDEESEGYSPRPHSNNVLPRTDMLTTTI
eukprot:CFRG1442T1